MAGIGEQVAALLEESDNPSFKTVKQAVFLARAAVMPYAAAVALDPCHLQLCCMAVAVLEGVADRNGVLRTGDPAPPRHEEAGGTSRPVDKLAYGLLPDALGRTGGRDFGVVFREDREARCWEWEAYRLLGSRNHCEGDPAARGGSCADTDECLTEANATMGDLA